MYPATTTSLRALRGARRLVHLRPLALISTTFINTHRPVYLRQSGALTAAAPSSFSTSSTSAANPPANSGRTDDEPQVRATARPTSLTQRILHIFGMGESLKRTKNSEALLQACISQASNTTFYRAGRISDSFRAAHGLLVVHVWMLHKRLLREGEEGKVLEEALFDRLWDETTARIRALKVNELSVNSYVKEVQSYSFGACVSYDAAQALETEEDRVDELAGALYRYVQRELDSLMMLPKEAIFESRFKWGPLPSWGGRAGGRGGGRVAPRYVRSDGKAVPDEEEEEEEGEEEVEKEEGKTQAEEEEDKRGEWRTAFSEQGRMYYWNVRTRESTYEKPY
ncbi:ubiquinol-cytochrome c chaperone [Nannochloropsis oceanica]